MAEHKQGHLNGAYYGPPIPPPRSHRSVGRSSSCCCGPCCILCNLFKFILSLVIIVGLIVLVLWLVFRPTELKAYVNDASLTRFNFSASDSKLDYNLTLDMSIRNPNKRVSIYYDRVEALAWYAGDRFGFDNLAPFYQGHKTTSELRPEFVGTQLMLGDSVGTTYNREKGEGFYYVDVKVNTKLRLKVWIFKIHYNRQHIDCSLKLPVPGTAASFEPTKCHVHFF